MAIFEGKSPAERNKIIAAVVLGVLALTALAYAFAPGFFSSSSKATAQSSPTPVPSVKPSSTDPNQFKLPSNEEQNLAYMIPVDYRRSDFYAPDPGRNIFAFYEPPPPTPWSPTPFVAPSIKPTPTPTPPYLIGFVMPQSVYSGSRGFRLEVNGDLFTPDAKIYFSQSLLPTNYVSPQRLTADVPANFITGEGPRQIIVQSTDGTKYSNQVMLQVQAPPKPQVQYVGMIARKFANNDTAYFIEQSKINTPGTAPTPARLNDVVGGRFRLVSISANEAILEDVNLGFRYPLKLVRPAPGTGGASGSPGGFPGSGFPTNTRPGSVPGFPNVTLPNPRPNSNSNRPQRKDDDEDDDDPND